MERRKDNRGATLIECVAAIIVLGVAIPPLVGLFTEVAAHSVDDVFQGVATTYADALMEEIVSKAFEDPEATSGSFGTEEGARALYDDVDDYDGMSHAPPERLDGTALDDYGGFTRSVTVDNVTSADPDPVTPAADGSTGLKRLRVTVAWTGGRGGEVTLTTLRTDLSGSDVSPLDEAGSAATAHVTDGKKLELTLVSASTANVQIASFGLSADYTTSALRKLELESVPGAWKEIWSAEELLPITDMSLNKGYPGEQLVPGSGSAGAYLEFKDDLDEYVPITFTLTLNFTSGATSTVVFGLEWP